jgi:hypothetical protein
VVVIGPALVIEVVKEGGQAPEVFIGTCFLGIGAYAGFDGEHVFAEVFGLSIFAQEIPGVFTGRHWASLGSD